MTQSEIEEFAKSGEEFGIENGVFSDDEYSVYKIVDGEFMYKSKIAGKYVVSFNNLNFFLNTKLVRIPKEKQGETYELKSN